MSGVLLCQNTHGFSWVAMETSKEFAKAFSLALKLKVLLIILDRDPTKLLQKLFFTFCRKKDLVLSKIAQRLGGLTPADTALMRP